MIRKKYLLVICLFISVCFNLILGNLLYTNISNSKSVNNDAKAIEKQGNEVQFLDKYSNYYFMTNPIDEYFATKFSDSTMCEIEFKDYQTAYEAVWKKEYNTIMTVIKNKCTYDDDIEIYNNFTKHIENSMADIEPMLLAEMLDNYNMPESPEKHSWGNGTSTALKMYNGMLYRNGCMLFIPYLEDEYLFPTIDDVNEYVKPLVSEE